MPVGRMRVGCADNDLIQRLGDLPDADGSGAAVKEACQHPQRQPSGSDRRRQGVQQVHQLLPDPILFFQLPQPFLLRFSGTAEGLDMLCRPDALQQVIDRCGKSRAVCFPQLPAEPLQRQDHPAAHPIDALQTGGIFRRKLRLEAPRMVLKGLLPVPAAHIPHIAIVFQLGGGFGVDAHGCRLGKPQDILRCKALSGTVQRRPHCRYRWGIRRPLGKVGKEGNAIFSEGALQRDAIGRKIPADHRDLLVAQSPPAHVLTDGSRHRRNLLIGVGGPDQGDPLPGRLTPGSGAQEVLLHPPESLALEPQRLSHEDGLCHRHSAVPGHLHQPGSTLFRGGKDAQPLVGIVQPVTGKGSGHIRCPRQHGPEHLIFRLHKGGKGVDEYAHPAEEFPGTEHLHRPDQVVLAVQITAVDERLIGGIDRSNVADLLGQGGISGQGKAKQTVRCDACRLEFADLTDHVLDEAGLVRLGRIDLQSAAHLLEGYPHEDAPGCIVQRPSRQTAVIPEHIVTQASEAQHLHPGGELRSQTEIEFPFVFKGELFRHQQNGLSAGFCHLSDPPVEFGGLAASGPA